MDQSTPSAMLDQYRGPRTTFAQQLHEQKYRSPGETFAGAMRRVAGVLGDEGAHRGRLLDALLDQRFLPAGRIQAAIGSGREVTAFNCFVSGTIPDSFVTRDNPERSSIMDRAREAATTMRMGGGIGYDFSTLRPKNALIQKLQSQSSGPLGFMPIFNTVCEATSSAGNRRGAQMGVLRIDHPDIRAFIHAKNNHDQLNGFNMSIAVTDEFMAALARGGSFPLRFGGQEYATVDAAELWEEVMQSTWDWGEPGVLFIDTVNRMNNLAYCENISACNPCAEQFLPPFGACNLGSLNMVKYLRLAAPGQGPNYLDFEQFEEDVETAVRALDNVTDNTLYPLPEQAAEARSKRRVGLGVTGLANALEACGQRYGTRGFLQAEAELFRRMERAAYLTNAKLGVLKGAFPLYDADRYGVGGYYGGLDGDIKYAVRKAGALRCSHVTSQAPTGTISMTADNVSSSIEPVYRWASQRRVKMAEGDRVEPLYDYGFAELRVRGRRAAFGEVTAKQHLAVLATAQRRIDSACSKTINCDGTMPWSDFKEIYSRAYELGAKGCTTFNVDGKRSGLFKVDPEAEDLAFPAQHGDLAHAVEEPYNSGQACTFDPATGRRTCE